jgi:FMN-dependent NADH-azoreductase
MKFLGISRFEELLVDGTGASSVEMEQAIGRAKSKIEPMLDKIIL